MKENQQVEKEYHYDEIDVISNVVSNWTKEAGTMLPKEPGDIKKMILSGASVVIWREWRAWPTPVAFGAVTFEWPDGWYELGCVVVDKKHRQEGLGHKIVKGLIATAKEKFPDGKLFALCNEKSLKLFLDNGAAIIKNPTILPKEVFEECINCPKFQIAKAQGKYCCDIPVGIK